MSSKKAWFDPSVEKQIKKILKDQEKAPLIKAQSTGVIKLKDGMGRGGLRINLPETFGFQPQFLQIQKVAGRNNAFVLSAEVPQEVILKEEAQAKRKAEKLAAKEKQA